MFLAWLLACSDSSSTTGSACYLDAPVLGATEVAPGDELTVTLAIPTWEWDLAVYIGAERAELLSLSGTDGCEDCDECRYAASCNHCGICEDCESDCESCVPVATVRVPALADGSWELTVLTGAGQLAPVSLVVRSPSDTGATTVDTGDSGTTADSGADSGLDSGDSGADTGSDTGATGADTGADRADRSTGRGSPTSAAEAGTCPA